MTTLFGPAALLQITAAGDTIFTRALPPVRTGFEQFVFASSALTPYLTLALLMIVIGVLVRLRTAAEGASQQLDTLLKEMRPLLEETTAASKSVRAAADIIKRDVEIVHSAVEDTSARVKQAVGGLADRVDDFSDLLGKVHSRADQAMEIASGALGGLAWGARKLNERRKRRKTLRAERRQRAERDADLDAAPLPRPDRTLREYETSPADLSED